ncbi:pyridoxal phosphate-dependent aminotransferase [Phenylobacterium sp.]|uniref:pyridoxal phosphate-dependent aminotransferase n=1 Tax=Phenylobacterium sp. TaxID=1871053 RepID=UPI002FCC18B9
MSFMRTVPYMGVIHVVAEAAKLGFRNGHPDWCNLGQGQPEVGPLAGAPPRISELVMAASDHAYGPINGGDDLREAVAARYNRLYRKGKASQYTPDNVAIVAGGRLALSRVFAALGEIAIGYQTPDYTAYEDLLEYHQHRFRPVHCGMTEAEGFRISPERLEREVEAHQLCAFLLSNPCNPTGEVISGEDLAAYVDIGRRRDCLMIFDEFYSHYVYDLEEQSVSAASCIEDVEKDPVLLLDGLTKNFRYPGWRVGWIVGPSELIEIIGRAASAIDGGPPQPLQRAALTVLESARADQETQAVRRAFAAKRALMRRELEALGVRFPGRGGGTFYLWGSIADLPAPYNDAEAFFRAALERKVMVVPGAFFDVNPGRRRQGPSPYADWLRFSYGPPLENVELGLGRLRQMMGSAQNAVWV